MRRFTTLILIGLISAVSVSAATAAPRKGSRLVVAPGAVESISARSDESVARALNAFGRCIARRSPDEAATVVGLPYADNEQKLATVRLIQRNEAACFNAAADIRFTLHLLVGGLAEQLILNRVDKDNLAATGDRAGAIPGPSEAAPRNGYEEMALCVVQRDAASVRALIESIPRTRSEENAFGRLIPHLGPCIAAGQSLSFNKTALRSILAAGLYRALPVLASPASTVEAAQ